MAGRIIQYRLGSSNIYLIQGERGYLVVDAGSPGKFGSFIKLLLAEKIKPEEIVLILLTHVHADHAGNLREIKEYTGARIMVHQAEADWLARGWVEIPNGTIPIYRFLSRLGQKRGIRLKFPPAKPDILIRQPVSLQEYGFDARVIPTPGHSAGSVSVFFNDGNTFVGDAGFNFPAFKRSILPGFAEDPDILFRTWRFFLESDAVLFHPGHGKPFTKEKIEKSIKIRAKP